MKMNTRTRFLNLLLLVLAQARLRDLDLDAQAVSEAFINNFDDYTVEKAHDLVIQRYNPNLSALGLVGFFHLIRRDVRCGKDGFTGQQIQASPIGMFAREVILFATELHGPDFGTEVHQVLTSELGQAFDLENFRTKC